MSHLCKFCGNEMNVSALEFKSNSYCNNCFDYRAWYAFYINGWNDAISEMLGVVEEREGYLGHYERIAFESDIRGVMPLTPGEFVARQKRNEQWTQ
jgi:hypothetical protein